jgi:hypothetical protein
MSQFSPDSAPPGKPWNRGDSRGLPIYIIGRTGKFEGARGYLDYLGLADLYQNTLVLVLCCALAENGRVFSWSCHT